MAIDKDNIPSQTDCIRYIFFLKYNPNLKWITYNIND